MEKCKYKIFTGFIETNGGAEGINIYNGAAFGMKGYRSKNDIFVELKDLYKSLAKPSDLDFIHAMNYSIKVDCDNRSEHLYMAKTQDGPKSYKLCKPKGECDFYENIEPSELTAIYYAEANKMVDSFL